MRPALPVLLAAGLFVTFGIALAQPPVPQPIPQPPGALDRALAARALAEQQAAAQVSEAITQAQGIARVAPEKAVRDLKSLRTSIATRADIGPAKQTELLAQLSTAVDNLTRAGKNPAGPAPIDPRLILRSEQNQKQHDAVQSEAKAVRDAVSEITKDEADGKLTDARAKIDLLAKRYPTNAVALQLKEFGLLRENLALAKAVSSEMSRRFDKNLEGVRMAALPPITDMEFPKDWKEITERRQKLNQVQLGAEEQALLQALETRISVPLRGQPFEEIIQTLSNAIGKNIYIDKASFDNLSLDMKQLVNLEGGVSARTALRGMLQSLGMTFIIRDKIIKVVSVEEARKNMMTRAYEIRDVVQAGGPFNGGATWGPYLDYMQTQRNAEMLVESIVNGVDPNAWSTRGGTSTITFNYATMSIIVRAPSEVHYSLGQAMYGGKKK